MKKTRVLRLLVLIAAMPVLAYAKDKSVLDEPAKQPDEPVIVSDYQPVAGEPEIVIRPGKKATFYEYRVNGELREIKVVPSVGPEYYLVPSDGGWIQQDKSQLLIPSWVIFRW